MLVTRGGGAECAAAPVAVTIGNFDGVHLGHQAMVARVVAAARALGVVPAALTFEPHPRELFAPASAPTRVTSFREKVELLARHGIERVHVRRFSRRFASLAPEAFVAQVLVRELRARWVLVGDDFRYGAKRAGDVAALVEAGREHGFDVELMPTVMLGGERASSTAVREALAAGDLARARRLLGRTYSIDGRVVHGDKLGRELGYATANVRMKHNRPPFTGIFAVRVHGVGAAARDGVASLGVRPTVTDSGRYVLEVHLFDFAEEIYGRHLRVEFLAKIRDEARYADLDTLKAQIARDCDAARDLLKQHDHA
jgi:riboflavin kinase/FMN adenylyltransferase